MMTRHQLPRRIVGVMTGTIIVLILTVAVSVLWMTRAMDEQARLTSATLLRTAMDNVASQVMVTTLDYSKWDEATLRVEALDTAWVRDNIGTVVTFGKAVQLAVLWGWPLQQDLGWILGGSEEGDTGLVAPDVLDQVEGRLTAIPLGAYEGTSFYAWVGEDLFALAGSRLEMYVDKGGAALPDDRIARLLLGRRVDASFLAGLEHDLLVSGVVIGRMAVSGYLSLPLADAREQAVAYLSWKPPQPGTDLLVRMMPVLLAVTGAAAGFVLLGMALARRSPAELLEAHGEATAAARTDALTDLPNRVAFNEALAVCARARERAVLFLDVNDFKRINDSIGHEAGDQVIVCLARRLSRLTSQGCFLARIAGDEFVFVVTGADAEGRVERLAARTADVLTDPISILGHQLQVTMATGYAVQAIDDMEGRDLVRQADLAMYQAKRHKGRPGAVAFSAIIEQASRNALEIEQGLRQAMTRPGELSIAYQPIVSADGRLVRAEALARWTSPEFGPVPPSRFIAVAEQAGLIVELGRQLFRIICADLAAHPDLEVSVNISTLQLMAPDFIPNIVHALKRHNVDPARIEVEITEAVLVDDVRLAAQRVEELRTAGFSIALDDFGSGYSSVGYLDQLRFDTLKIDRSFVSRIRQSPSGIAVVDAMIRMAHGLELRVVCEGVETVEDLDLLRELGSDMVQGYHLDRPLTIDRLIARWLTPAQDSAAVA